MLRLNCTLGRRRRLLQQVGARHTPPEDPPSPPHFHMAMLAGGYQQLGLEWQVCLACKSSRHVGLAACLFFSGSHPPVWVAAERKANVVTPYGGRWQAGRYSPNAIPCLPRQGRSILILEPKVYMPTMLCRQVWGGIQHSLQSHQVACPA